ncbi:MAG: cytochrome C oxidase subunit IV family protein [Cyclobacteriaceae bacterium]|nr:cytochrome C oxidase subunit IV family protein [Cyclobacteriaceae bacterium]
MEQVSQVEVKPVNKEKVKNFLRVMWYLAAITAIEFGIAFTIPHEYKWGRITVFILLTIVKAYYIVSEFMHLGHEKKSLKMSIVLPLLFVVFLIFIMLYQAQAIYELIN